MAVSMITRPCPSSGRRTLTLPEAVCSALNGQVVPELARKQTMSTDPSDELALKHEAELGGLPSGALGE